MADVAPTPDWPAAGPAAPAMPRSPNRETPLVPPATISSRSLVIVIVIMSFLASMAAGTAVLVARASQQWSGELSREASIQIRPKAGVDLDAEVARVSDLVKGIGGVASLHAFSRDESEKLLEPWLGQNLNFDDLPVPRLIIVSFERGSGQAPAAVRDLLTREAPGATFDDHRAWSERLSTMGRTLVVVAVLVLILILLAMALAVAFATSGAMAGSREIVDVLHFVGATDAFVCRQYEKQFLLFGLQGGGGGAALACLAFLVIGFVSRRWVTSNSDGQVEALFGSFTLGLPGYVCIAIVALFVAATVTLTSRFIVSRQLTTLG